MATPDITGEFDCDESPQARALENLLNGTRLGEPLHVILTDLPIQSKPRLPSR